MKKISLKPLPLALACLLAAVPLAQADAAHHAVRNPDIMGQLNMNLVPTRCHSVAAFNPNCTTLPTLAHHAGNAAHSDTYGIDLAYRPTRRAQMPALRSVTSTHGMASMTGAYHVNLTHLPAPHTPTSFSIPSVTSSGQAAPNATSTPTSLSIPLDLIHEDYGNGQYGFRLGINVGVNGGDAKEYMFDTGSDLFNIDVGSNPSPAWFPDQGAPQSAAFAYLYGDGSYGYWEKSTTVGNIQFYDYSTGQQVANYDTSRGMPVAIATDWIVTQDNYYFGNDTLGNPITKINGIGTLYQDLTWQQSLDAGQAPEEGIFYGTFGAGDFGTGVPGMLTRTGYIVEANGTGATPGSCKEACLIMGLTPALRAQFLSVVPWFGTPGSTFPLTGNDTAYQFDTAFWYTLTDGDTSHSVGLVTLLDTGTPNIMITDDGLATAEQTDGNLNANGNIAPGLTLASQGLAVTPQGLFLVGQADAVTTGSDTSGDYSTVVTVASNYGGFGSSAIYGIGFFMRNAVMYDLENHATGFTPFFVTAAPITTGFTVTQSSGPLGLAGTISGSGAFQIDTGGIVNMSGTNTYTGATDIASGAWLGLAGPGTIEHTASVNTDGVFDISRAWQTSNVASLSGGGTVLLGGGVLNLTQASGSFGGTIADGGLGGGVGGRVLISAGQEILSGTNTYTGLTGIAAPATLILNGSLPGSVANLGTLVDNGSIGGNVVSDGLILGSGSIAGNLTVNGAISAGGNPGNNYTLHVGGDYQQAGDTTYTVQFDPTNAGNASRIAVDGQVTLGSNIHLQIVPNGHGIFHVGHQYTVFDAASGLNGQFTLSGSNAISAVLGVTLSTDARHAYLDVMQNRSLTAITGTANQTSTLAGVQGLATSSDVFAAVTSLPTDAAIRTAADALSGEQYASVQGALIQQTLYLREAVDGRLRQAATGAVGPTTQSDQGGLDWWTQAVAATGYHDGNANVARQTHDTKGFIVGADRAMGSNGRLGVTLSATNTAMRVRERNSRASSKNFSLGVYGGVQLGGFGLRAGAAIANHVVAGNRAIQVPGLVGRTESDYTVHTDQVFAATGYRFQFHSTAVEPFLRAAWIHLDGSDFRERGAVAGLTSTNSSQSATQATLGLRVSTRFALTSGSLTLHEMLGEQHVLDHRQTTSTMAFAGGPTFAVHGLPLLENATTAGIGLAWQANESFSLDLGFKGRFASGASDKEAHLRLDWWF